MQLSVAGALAASRASCSCRAVGAGGAHQGGAGPSSHPHPGATPPYSEGVSMVCWRAGLRGAQESRRALAPPSELHGAPRSLAPRASHVLSVCLPCRLVLSRCAGLLGLCQPNRLGKLAEQVRPGPRPCPVAPLCFPVSSRSLVLSSRRTQLSSALAWLTVDATWHIPKGSLYSNLRAKPFSE